MPSISCTTIPYQIRYELGPEKRKPLPGSRGFYVRVSQDLRKTVVFFGHEDNTPGKGGINCVGTGFLLGYEDVGYLVTAKHLADVLGSDPFLVRVNLTDGTSQNILADNVTWYRHPSPEVDVAVIQVMFGVKDKFDVQYLPSHMMLTDTKLQQESIGIGDLTYTVGLFRLLSGSRRNMPILHSGIVAMMPGDETIPVWDWRSPRSQGCKLYVDGYLVETHGMPGLSGSPVFVRATVALPNLPLGFQSDPRFPLPASLTGLAARQDVMLLGLWQGSWDAPPDEILGSTMNTNSGDRVPVGMGIVVPAQRIMEVLLMDEVKKQRQEMIKQIHSQTGAAAVDVAIPVAKNSVEREEASPQSSDENPTHREDFTRLVGAAARKPPQVD